jgi:xanthine dehydrogenase accessory factor
MKREVLFDKPNSIVNAEFTEVLHIINTGNTAQVERMIDGQYYVRRFVPKARLILLGGGHIAVPLCKIASLLDFSVTVVDDRPGFANRGRFPDAEQILCAGFTESIQDLEICPSDYICVITRGHRWDADCLRAILPGCFPSYLGMIGSKRRVSGLLRILEVEGYDSKRLSMIRTPVGLNIRAKTPAEIAVSICAEMILHRRSRNDQEENVSVLERTDTDLSLLRFLAEDSAPGAVIMVLSVNGSAPARPGALMVTDRIGRTFGTVGGGCGEAEAIRVARQLIGTGRSTMLKIDLTDDIAAEEGMVCGGTMNLLVEDIKKNC